MPLWIRFDGLEAGGQRGSDVYINHAAPVTTDMRFDRTDRLGRDGQMAGTDLISKSVWDFTLHTNQQTEDEALAFASAWQRAWRDPDVRDGTKTVPLEYSRNRQDWFRVFGRPTLFTGPELDVFTVQGRGVLDLQFEQLDPLHYSENKETATLYVAPGASGGLTVPVSFPIEMAGSGGVRDLWATNSGDNPAPVIMQFNGPLANPVVALQGHWRFALTGTLQWDEFLVVDARARTIKVHSKTNGSERSAYSWIRKGSRFSDLIIPPGQHALSFEGTDDTATASVNVSWPHTYQTMQ